MIEDLKPEDIDVTLKYGHTFSSKAWHTVIVAMYVLLGVVAALILSMLIGIPLTIGKYDEESVVTIIGCSSASSLILLINIIIHRFSRLGRKHIDECLKDAVILKAYAESKGKRLIVRGFMARAAIAIEVHFVYDDMRYVRQSLNKKGGNCIFTYFCKVCK
ncbi:MAG: hypothetical protein J1G38_07540 [Clostridiales bacterium]|nr:hypothetical protein [Clostridiales bacterium]